MYSVEQFKTILFESIGALSTKVLTFGLNILTALFVLMIGLLIAKIISKVVSKLLEKIGINKLSDSVGISGILNSTGIATTASRLIGKIIFWLILMIFFISMADFLGLSRVSGTIDEFVLYLPKIIGAIIILFFGLLVAHFVRNTILGAAQNMNVDYAKPLSSFIYGFLVLISVSLAIGQLDIEITLLNQVIQILLFAVAAAVAISMGIGTRQISANIMAGIYARDIYHKGNTVNIGNIDGVVEAVGTTKTLIKVSDGSMLSVPNTKMITSTIVLK